MDKRKNIGKWACFSIILFILAQSVFLSSVYFGKQSKDPDAYEFLGWFAMLGIMFLASVASCVTLGIWLSQRNKTLSLFKD